MRDPRPYCPRAVTRLRADYNNVAFAGETEVADTIRDIIVTPLDRRNGS